MRLFDALQGWAEHRPDATAFVFEDEPWSYGRLLDATERLAQGLAAQGVQPGDRVALHMHNRPELFIGYLGCFRLGAVAAPINTRLKPAEVRGLLERLQVKLYLGQDTLFPVVADLEDPILPARARFVAGRGPDPRVRTWAELLSDAGGNEPAPDHGGGLAVLLATSGTTGEPKFVTHTHATLGAMIEGALGSQIATAGPLAVSTPAVHILGLLTFLAAIRSGVSAVVLERLEANALLDAIAKHAVGGMAAAPFMYAQLVERQRARPRDVSNLTVCVVGGDACAPELQLAFAEVFGCPLRNIWGATETGVLRLAARIGPVIRAAEWLAVRVLDDCGAPVGIGEVGELLVRGPSVTPGYWLGPDHILDATLDGWFPTGDLVRREEGDEFCFVGRKKDVIVRGGSNIAPLEVELVIRAHPGVAEVAVMGVPDDILGERVAALIELAPATAPDIVADILACTRKDLADYKVPERVRVVSELPRNALGKVDRREAARLLAAEAN